MLLRVGLFSKIQRYMLLLCALLSISVSTCLNAVLLVLLLL